MRALLIGVLVAGMVATPAAARPPGSKLLFPGRLAQTPLRTSAAKRAATDYLAQQAIINGAPHYSLTYCDRRRARVVDCWGTIGPLRVCVGDGQDLFNCPYRIVAGEGLATRVRSDYGRVQVRERWTWDLPIGR